MITTFRTRVILCKWEELHLVKLGLQILFGALKCGSLTNFGLEPQKILKASDFVKCFTVRQW